MPQSRWLMVVIGLLVVAAGLFPMLDALGVFAGSESRMNAPRWVVFLAGSLFFTCGMWLLLHAFVSEAVAMAFGAAVGLFAYLGLAAIVNWIAFGGGDRNDCSGGISGLGFGFSRSVAEIECRAAFGWGALLLDFFFLRGTAWWIAQRAPGNRAARAFEMTSEWGIGLLLLPLILILAVPAAIKKVREKLAGKQNPKGP